MPQLSGISTARIGNLRVSDDLKESPLGSLGGKRVQTGAPGAPRVAAQGQAVQGGGSPSIFSRLNYTFSSTAKRSELDFRDDLKAASGEVADLLGAISQVSGKNPETADVENLLSQLPGKTERLTDPVRGSMRWDENGADPSEQYKPGWRMNMFVRERTVVHVSNMTPQQRESVRVGLEALKSTTVAADPLVKEVEQARVAQGHGRRFGFAFRSGCIRHPQCCGHGKVPCQDGGLCQAHSRKRGVHQFANS